MAHLVCRNHDSVWSNEGKRCFACAVKYMENEEAPFTRRQYALVEVLEELDLNNSRLSVGFKRNLKFADDVLVAIITLYNQLKDVAIKPSVLNGVLYLVHKFGSRSILKISSIFLEIEIDVPTVATCYHLFSFLNDMLNHIPTLIENLLFSGRVIFQISQCLCVPDDKTRVALLQIATKFASHCVNNDVSLEVCSCLTKPLISILSSSDSANVLTCAMNVFCECAASDEFAQWVVFGEEFQESGCVKKQIDNLFSQIKRCFMIHTDILNICLVKLITLLISKQHLEGPLLDSDILGFVFDALKGTTNVSFIQIVYSCILQLSEEPSFYSSFHAVYGLSSICKSLMHLLPSDAGTIVCSGFEVTLSLLKHSPADVPLLHTVSLFDQTLQVIVDGIMSKDGMVVSNALETACFFVKKSNLPHPLPFRDLISLVEKLEQVFPEMLQKCDENESELFSQNVTDKAFEKNQKVCLNLLIFFGQCFVLLGDNSSQHEKDILELDFMEKLFSSLTEYWIPCVQVNIDLLGNPDVSQVFFEILEESLHRLNKSEQLFGFLVANKFLELSLRNCTRLPQCHSIPRFLSLFCSNFLLNLGCSDPKMLCWFQQGFPRFKGQPTDILYLLREFPLGATSCSDVTVSVVTSVVTTLAMTCWFDQCLVPIPDLTQSLYNLVSTDRSLSSLPLFARTLVLFLLCLSQNCELTSAVFAELPPDLVNSLKATDSHYLHHPACLSCLLQINDEILCTDDKVELVKRWLSEVDDVTPAFYAHQESRHLMGLMLLNQNVASVVLESLTSCSEDAESKKVILLVSGAVAESSYSETDDSSPPEFVTCLSRQLPEFAMKQLTMDNLKQVPIHITSSLFDLLTIVIETNQLDDVTTHRMLRQALSLICDAFSDDDINDVVTASLLHLVEEILKARTGPEANSEVIIVLSHTRFLPSLQESLRKNLVAQCSKSNYLLSFEIQLIALLVSLVQVAQVKVTYRIQISVEKMLQCCQEDRVECAMLKLWTSLYQCAFASDLLFVEATPPKQPRDQLVNDVDVMLAPLNHSETIALYVASVNATVKGFPGIQLSALRCVRAMLAHVRHVTRADPLVFHDLGTSPWLKLALDLNATAKDEAVLEVCKDIQLVCEGQEWY